MIHYAETLVPETTTTDAESAPGGGGRALFADGFESGDLSAWRAATGGSGP